MNLLLDTNILLYLSKDPNGRFFDFLGDGHQPKLFVSVVSIAEVKAIAIQNNWGDWKWQTIGAILDEVVIIEINENLIDTYAQIDAFSQRRNPAYDQYDFDTPRNMGKNDLWIASTAALLGLKLISTDADFVHLHEIFIEFQLIDAGTIRQLTT